MNLEDLLLEGELDTSMAKWCQHRLDDGAQLILMAEGGKEYARQELQRLGIESFFFMAMKFANRLRLPTHLFTFSITIDTI